MENKENKSQSKYNLNESDFLLLGKLQEEAFYYRNIKRDYYASLERWVSVRVMVGSRFETSECEELDNIHTEFSKIPKIKMPNNLSRVPSFGNLSPRSKFIKTILTSHKISILDKYSMKLRLLMRLYKIALTDLEKKAELD